MKTYLPLRSLGCFTACALFLSAPPLLAEVTPVQTIEFTDLSDSASTALTSGELINQGAGVTLTDFDKFDPALGTLIEILFTVELRATASLAVSAGAVDDEENLFSVRFEDSGGSFFSASLDYFPNGGSFGETITAEYGNPGSVGGEGLTVSEYGNPGEFFYYESVGLEFGGFANGGDTPNEGSLLAGNPAVNLDDFVGTGAVEGLNLIISALITGDGIVDNVPDASLDAEYALDPGSVTLQYVYTPAATSVPTKITGYTKSGTNHTILFTGGAGRSDWAVKGGNDLITFGTDHTAAATISETSAGVYQVLLSLPELTEPRYFFRIEE